MTSAGEEEEEEQRRNWATFHLERGAGAGAVGASVGAAGLLAFLLMVVSRALLGQPPMQTLRTLCLKEGGKEGGGGELPAVFLVPYRENQPRRTLKYAGLIRLKDFRDNAFG